MYYNIIKNYIERLDINDIYNYGLKENIKLNDNELKIIYKLIKNNWEDLYKGKIDNTFQILKNNVRNEVYEKALNLYNTSKKLL